MKNMKKLIMLLLFATVFVRTSIAQHSVKLTWTAGAGGGAVATFNVKRATVTGGPYTTVGSAPVAQPTYTDTSGTGNMLIEGTTYYYVVTATGPGGESGPSNESKASIPFLRPSAPSGLQAVPQ